MARIERPDESHVFLVPDGTDEPPTITDDEAAEVVFSAEPFDLDGKIKFAVLHDDRPLTWREWIAVHLLRRPDPRFIVYYEPSEDE